VSVCVFVHFRKSRVTMPVEGWGYAQQNGPHTWHQLYPIARGRHQSPLDICPDQCHQDHSLSAITVDYGDAEVGELINNGHQWQAVVTSGRSWMTGGPFRSTFSLKQIHAHWGVHESAGGSEHTVNGQQHSGELHLVFFDSDKYCCFDEAKTEPRGLAVLGIFMKVGPTPHPEVEKLVRLMPLIPYLDQKVNINEPIHCQNFMPDDRSYFTYDGSLTTPPLFETVNWVVFREPIEVSREQLAAFRSLHSFHRGAERPSDELRGQIMNNFRPPNPSNGRSVRVFQTSMGEEQQKYCQTFMDED